MKFLRKQNKNWKKPFSERIARRVSMVSTEDLDAWIDPSIDDIKRFMFMYGKTKDPAHLADALLSAEVLHAIIDAVYTRVAPK